MSPATAVGRIDARRVSTGWIVHGGHLLGPWAPTGGHTGAGTFPRPHDIVNGFRGTHFVKHVTST
ncbi:hypothetical protein G419_19950 [Rhodococcus triatomae BKS 15-14]|nr:hypothetical protein G419_19950 [Rhodococcus triatomae BKS 15-14]